MKIAAIVIISFLILGFLFINWANKPENVEALKQKRASDAAEKMEKPVVPKKEKESNREAKRLAIDEKFTLGHFEKLDFNDHNISYFKFGKNEFNFAGLITKGQNAQDYFITSKEDFQDFEAELQVGIWGDVAFTGIFWDAQKNGGRNPKVYEAAYASPDRLYVEAGKDDDRFGLGGLIASENNQLIRVERFGTNVKVSVNGKVFFDKNVESTGPGKIGILVGHRGGTRSNAQTISVGIKSFKVWK